MSLDKIAPTQHGKNLFCFGFGYTASYLSQRLMPCGWTVSGTTTDEGKAEELADFGITSHIFETLNPLQDPYFLLKDVTHILISIPPDASGDLVCDIHGLDLAELPNLEWVGYLSTTAIYGNREGDWVDEETPTAPMSKRGSHRLRAEQQWLEMYHKDQLPVHIFRLAGIYGPGRSAIDAVRSGTARRIDKTGHTFNRAHISDIVQTLIASMDQPTPGEIFNVSDDMPAPSHEVIKYACELMGMDIPELIPYEQIDMAPIVRSFYKENKRVKNDKIKQMLGVKLICPNYKVGLDNCFEFEKQFEELIDDEAV